MTDSMSLPEQMWGETRVELPRRITAFIRRRGLDRSIGDDLAEACSAAVESNVVILDEGIYAALEDEARARSDPADWPVVASALALTAGSWTNDNDFVGTVSPRGPPDDRVASTCLPRISGLRIRWANRRCLERYPRFSRRAVGCADRFALTRPVDSAQN